MQPFLLSHALATLVGIAVMSACNAPESARSDWAQASDSMTTRRVGQTPSTCRRCIGLEEIVILGDSSGPGHIVETAFVAQDSTGRYWLGQHSSIKVFDARGRFVKEVGRSGEGPMEFRDASPIFTDDAGRVHVIDRGRARESVIGANYDLHTENRLPGIVLAAAPLNQREYVVNMSLATPDGIGLPMHVIDGQVVRYSFGAPPDGHVRPLNARDLQRVVAVDAKGRIFTAAYYEYLIEAWTPNGRRIARFVGPQLNEALPAPGRWSPENPPPSRLFGLQADQSGFLWVLTWRLKENWDRYMVETVLPNGQIQYGPLHDRLDSIFSTQIDIIDLDRAAIIASIRTPRLFGAFAGKGLLLEVRETASGIPQIGIWRAILRDRT